MNLSRTRKISRNLCGGTCPLAEFFSLFLVFSFRSFLRQEAPMADRAKIQKQELKKSASGRVSPH